MLGRREAFHYFACESCDCLQLIDPPADLSAYYPVDQYYRFNPQTTPEPPAPHRLGRLRRWVKHHRDAAILLGTPGTPRPRPAWQAVCRRFPNPGIADLARILRSHPRPSFSLRIVDVGCRDGGLLRRLAELGFANLLGIDPYIDPAGAPPDVPLRQQTMDQLAGDSFDIVMLHHALEHMPGGIDPLRQIARLLRPDGIAYIRIPIVSEGPWKRYGADWAEIDAPRHFYLHSPRSLAIAARAAGLQIIDQQPESEAFSYAASELYRRDLPLRDPHKAAERPEAWRDHFTPGELARFADWAAEDLAHGRAGRAAFVLQHATGS